MKTFNKIIAFLTALTVLLFASFITANAEELPSYNAYKEFSKTQGAVWKYQTGSNSGGRYKFEDIKYDTDSSCFGDTDVGMVSIIENDQVSGKPSMTLHSGLKSDAVLTFIAPHTGKITLKMDNGGVYCPNNGEIAQYDGVNFGIYLGENEVFYKEALSSKNSPADKRVFTGEVSLDIKKNERIYFIVNLNKNNNNDGTRFNPVISYTSLGNDNDMGDSSKTPKYKEVIKEGSSGIGATLGSEENGVYRLSTMFSDKADIWSYYWHDGTKLVDMAYSDGEWNGQTETTNASTAKVTSNMIWHPFTSGYTVVGFKCPKSGNITIGMEEQLQLTSADKSADGTTLLLMTDNDVLGDYYLLESDNPKADFKPVTIDVYEGQMIYFYLNMNINNAGDSTLVTPYVKYNNYKDVPKKTVDITDTIKIDPKLKTDIEGNELAEVPEFSLNILWLILGILSPILVFAVAFFAFKKIKSNT